MNSDSEIEDNDMEFIGKLEVENSLENPNESSSWDEEIEDIDNFDGTDGDLLDWTQEVENEEEVEDIEDDFD